MKILVAEDDRVAGRVLIQAIKQLGHEAISVTDGVAALAELDKSGARLVVSDWMMPKMDGLELCRNIRSRKDEDYVYFILLTAQSASGENRREAADAGVDDFLTKPLDSHELWMRLRVAERILRYSTQVRQLEEFLPICSYCKKIRDDQNYWTQIEAYINQRTGTDFSHSVCPDCYERVIRPQLEKLKASSVT